MNATQDLTLLDTNNVDVTRFRLLQLDWHGESQATTVLLETLLLNNCKEQFAIVTQSRGDRVSFLIVKVANLLASLNIVQYKLTVFKSKHDVLLIYEDESLGRLEIQNVVGFRSY